MVKFLVENGKISGGEWEHFGWRNIFVGKCLKKGIGKSAYREMLFYKKNQAIPIAPLQVHYYSEALPTTARILYRSFTPMRTGNCK